MNNRQEINVFLNEQTASGYIRVCPIRQIDHLTHATNIWTL